jgi:nucleotide-binding universal stress UspA family protein
MFRHILIPTDGSPAAARAVEAGIAYAKQTGARVTGYHALEPVPLRMYGEGYLADRKMVAEFERRGREAARRHVAKVARAALAAGVRFEARVEKAVTPYDGIAEAAEKHNCDLIFMASHGRRGLQLLLLGSVAAKVLQRTKVPVLVYR